MSYLILTDFQKLIQADNLQQVIGYDANNLNALKEVAVTEAISYLIQKYDTTLEFTDTLVWDKTVEYKGRARIYLDATAYSVTATYMIGDLVLQAGNVYRCTVAILSGEVFNIGKWSLLGARYDIFYATAPNNLFDYTKTYLKDDTVFYKDKVYTALKPSEYYNEPIGNWTIGQQGLPNGIRNVFPDDTESGAAYWGSGVAYVIAAGTLPTDTTKWTKGDNRNPQMVNYCVDICLYHAHSRISPRNIPELRVKRYDDAIDWLKGAAQGKFLTANIPVKQPLQGGRIRWGSKTKLNNSY